MKKFLLFWLIGTVVALYTTFAVECLWNWFATLALHVPEISFWGMYGLVLLIGLLADYRGQEFTAEQRWKRMLLAVDACIPEEKREDIKTQIENEDKVGIWIEAGSAIFAKVVGTTFVLLLGFVLHVFIR
jgi:hypothetical protein